MSTPAKILFLLATTFLWVGLSQSAVANGSGFGMRDPSFDDHRYYQPRPETPFPTRPFFGQNRRFDGFDGDHRHHRHDRDFNSNGGDFLGESPRGRRCPPGGYPGQGYGDRNGYYSPQRGNGQPFYYRGY